EGAGGWANGGRSGGQNGKDLINTPQGRSDWGVLDSLALGDYSRVIQSLIGSRSFKIAIVRVQSPRAIVQWSGSTTPL
ncbi:MAG: hypothetical protein ABWY57_09165, partial [Mycetocola sp.]